MTAPAACGVVGVSAVVLLDSPSSASSSDSGRSVRLRLLGRGILLLGVVDGGSGGESAGGLLTLVGGGGGDSVGRSDDIFTSGLDNSRLMIFSRHVSTCNATPVRG